MLVAVSLVPDDNDTLLATCSDLPEVTSFGETEAKALDSVRDGILFALQIEIGEREDIPAFRKPRKGQPVVELGSRVAAKLAIYRAMRAKRWRKADLARAMKVPASDIDRLLDLNYRTGHEMLDAALAAQGLKQEIRVVAA